MEQKYFNPNISQEIEVSKTDINPMSQSHLVLNPMSQSTIPDSQPIPTSTTTSTTTTTPTINIPLHIKSSHIRSTLDTLLPQYNYYIIDHQKTSLTEHYLLQSKRSTMKQLLSMCLPSCCLSSPSLLSLSIILDQHLCQKTLSLKSIQGSTHLYHQHHHLSQLLSHLQSNLTSPSHNHNHNHNHNTSDTDNHHPHTQVKQVSLSLECYSYYHFYKVLCSHKYTIGQQSQEYCLQIQRDSQINAQQLIESLCVQIHKTSDMFFQEYNYAKTETKQLMPYCYISIEKYYFSILSSKITNLYHQTYNPTQSLYLSKRSTLLSLLTPIQQLQQLDIKPKYQLSSQPTPYSSAIDSLNAIHNLQPPHEQLRHLLNSYNAIKIAVVHYYSSQQDVYTMDDELPLIIYTVLNASSPHLFQIVNLLFHYYNQFTDYDNEIRILTNYQVSFDYILHSWQ